MPTSEPQHQQHFAAPAETRKDSHTHLPTVVPQPRNNIAALLADKAHNNDTALIVPSAAGGVTHISYRELAQAAARVQDYLQGIGVREGDRVALSLPNVPLMPAIYYGVLAAGAICVPLNPLLSAAELGHHIQDSTAKVLFAWEGTRLAEEAPRIPHIERGTLRLEILRAVTGQGPETCFAPFHMSPPDSTQAVLTPLPVCGADPALILYTSGTTGKPKGATLTHANILSNAHSCAEVFGFTNADIIFGGLPLFHAFGQTVSMNATFSAGAAVALLPRFTPADALYLIEQARVSVLAAVPSMYLALADVLESNPESSACLRGRIRFGISGGSPLPEPAHRRFEKLISCPIYEGYGLSETSPVVCFNRSQFGLIIGSVGRVLPGVRIQVRKQDGTPAPTGEAGQLWISGENVMAGYWENPEATEQAFDGSWFASGDIASIDADNNIYILDRIKDMVLRNGYSVYPREIEDVLYAHPQVRTAAVVGVPDERVGEEILAVILPREATNTSHLEHELDSLARTHLAAYKHPRRYLFVNELPLGPTGKILKRELRAALGLTE